jgi:beta-lactamase regulating signal transducer with metallopeptidase domain
MMNETAAAGIELEAISWQGLLFLGWLIGMLLLLALLVKRAYFVRGLIAQSRPANERLLEMLEECRCRIGISQNIELRLSDNTLSPAVCGLFKPIILIPHALLKKLSPEKLKAVLIHELAHIKRDDAWVNLLQTIVQIVFFYNPFVWIANAMVRRAREQAVDEMVLVTLNPEAKNYSNMLIDIAEMAFWKPKYSLSLIGVVESKKALERRIKHMLNRPIPKSAKLGFVGLIAIVLIGAIILPMGRNPAEQTALAAPVRDEQIADNKIVPGIRVGEYTLGISKDDVLKELGEPDSIQLMKGKEVIQVIHRGEEKYNLNNLPKEFLMAFGDVSFGIEGDSVGMIFVRSRLYKLSNGLRVGNSEQRIKQVFGDDFKPEEALGKDYLCYHAKGLAFEIGKKNQTIGEIVVYHPEGDRGDRGDRKADIPPTSYINDEGRIVDKIDWPFVNDPQLIGTWESVDFVGEMEGFKAGEKQWKGRGGELYLKGLIFKPNGKTFKPWWTWTKGLVFHSGDKTASKYTIKNIEGSTYMFYEWKSGDYTIRHRKPAYYVLKKVSSKTSGPLDKVWSSKQEDEIMGDDKAHIPATSTINEQGRIVDKVDYPFVNDPKVVGGWKSVDFVREINEFNPPKKNWRGELWLNHIIFEEGGTISRTGETTWTKGLVLDEDTASKYIIREIDGSAYMFFEWKSGDYTIRHRKPAYYVLKKVLPESLKYEPKYGKKADIPPTSYINEEGRIVDKIDWPFVNDPQLIGTWESVDFVGEMEEFEAGEKQWGDGEGDLYLKGLIFKPNGRTFKPWWTWTKGLIFHSGDKTASKYTIKHIKGSTYMFYEWKSGDYVLRYSKPSYYVLKKVSSKTSGPLDKVWVSKQEDDDDDEDDEEDEEFTRRLPAKIRQLNIDTADYGRVIEIFGKPIKYVWGKKTFTEDDLPIRYIMVYPSQFRVFMSGNKIAEIRHESGFNYVFRGKLRHGSTLDEVFEVIGHPENIVEGEQNSFEDGVLYKDIDGRKGHCYYARSDQNVRLWFLDYKIIAIYMTRSEHGASAAPRKGLIGLELNDKRWPLVDIVPGMPAAKAGLQNGDKILKVNDQDITHFTTIRDALEVLRGDPSEQVMLTIQRGGQVLTFIVERSK